MTIKIEDNISDLVAISLVKEVMDEQAMKVFIVVNDYSNMEEHCGEYRDCFLNEIEAYQFALRLANDNMNDKIRVIEKDFNDK